MAFQSHTTFKEPRMFSVLLASIVLMGAPGSGKSCFAKEYVKRHPDVVHFSVGDWIREEMANETPLGQKISEELKKESFIQNGYLLEESFINEVVGKKIQEITAEGKTFILDGFPRNLSQAKFLETLVKDVEVLYLSVDLQLAKERMLKRGRENDSEEVIDGRLAAFENVTKPVIECFNEKGVLVEIDASSHVPPAIVDLYEKMP